MPYESLEYPSLGIAALVACLKKSGLEAKAVYPRFWFAERIGLDRYVALSKLWHPDIHLPDWTFAGALFPEFEPDHQHYLYRIFQDKPFLLGSYREIFGKDADICRIFKEVRGVAKEFVADAARKILENEPRIVGCSSTFEQNCASLALLRMIKELAPNTITILGGADCDGAMGKARRDAFPWVDFIISGEADRFFPVFCSALLKGDTNAALKELLDRDRNDAHLQFEKVKENSALDDLPVPDHGDYFEALDSSPLKDRIYPVITAEASRGCWWNRCNFCGIEQGKMHYRAKSSSRVMSMLNTLYERHHVPYFAMSDNILDLSQFDSLITELSSRATVPYTLFWEMKSNLDER